MHFLSSYLVTRASSRSCLSALHMSYECIIHHFELSPSEIFNPFIPITFPYHHHIDRLCFIKHTFSCLSVTRRLGHQVTMKRNRPDLAVAGFQTLSLTGIMT